MSASNAPFFSLPTCTDARGMVDPILLRQSLCDTLNIGSLDGSRKRTVNRPSVMNALSGLETRYAAPL